jgi:hypothetical protein
MTPERDRYTADEDARVRRLLARDPVDRYLAAEAEQTRREAGARLRRLVEQNAPPEEVSAEIWRQGLAAAKDRVGGGMFSQADVFLWGLLVGALRGLGWAFLIAAVLFLPGVLLGLWLYG